MFHRWPTATHAAAIHHAAADTWPSYRDEVTTLLNTRPAQAVSFALHTLDDPELAWRLAHDLGLDEPPLWAELADRYETIDPTAVLPIHIRQIHALLENADAKHYRTAARKLAHLRALTKHTNQAADIDRLIADLRDTHRRRPRLQQEFDRARLP